MSDKLYDVMAVGLNTIDALLNNSYKQFFGYFFFINFIM